MTHKSKKDDAELAECIARLNEKMRRMESNVRGVIDTLEYKALKHCRVIDAVYFRRLDPFREDWPGTPNELFDDV